MAESRFVNLTSYCVVEYQFEPLGSSNFYTDNFVLVNNTAVGSHQIFNNDSSLYTTYNVRDVTVVPIDSTTYAYLDSEKVPNYLSYNTKLSSTNITGHNVVMDRVRFHFVSGFEFDNFVSLILSIYHPQNNGINNIFANILLAPETISQLLAYNPRPLFLSNALYDRYVDVLVPSIKNINEDFITAPVQSSTFAAAITPGANGPVGFVYNNPISIGLAECSKKKIITTDTSTSYASYEVGDYFTASLSQSNEFDAVGAYVNESANGDFIEFYMTFNSAFPEELITILNKRNPADDWIIVHQLSVFEQVGSDFINTGRLVFFQEDSYDEANVFRPVLKNASTAISMSIDYLARLTNRRNGEQIIREASFSLISPKKYGKTLLNLELFDKPQSQRVYNKIVKNNFEATKLFVEPTLPSKQPVVTPATPATVTTITKTEYVPVFFNNNNISVSHANTLITNKDNSQEVVFGPGKLRFVLSPFDNVLKLKVYTNTTKTSGNSLVPLDLNLNNPTYKLVFETSKGKIEVKNANSSKEENLSSGQVTFNISKKQSEDITHSKNKVVYLISVGSDGKETLMYSGEWRKPNEQADVDAAIAAAKAEATSNVDLNAVLSSIKDKIKELDVKDLATKIAGKSQIKSQAVASVVNKFGTPDSKSVQATSKNTK
jgi:hypothetical protein